jgi:Zn-finger nucleic acid-binding protein
MKCPVCKVTTTAVEHDKIEVDFCHVCRGIWFDRGELELLLDSFSGGNASALIKGLAQRPKQKVAEKSRRCPICAKKMNKAGIGSGQKIVIDVCGEGHGLWFDGGESGAFFRQLQLEQPAGADPLSQTLFFIRDTISVSPGAPGNS